MSQKNNVISPEVLAVIAAALGRYLREDQVAFSAAPPGEEKPANFSLWALAGRTDIMNGYRRRRQG